MDNVNLLLFVGIGIALLGLILILYFYKQRRGFGILGNYRIYQDSENHPGETLFATSIPLCGKPDYLIKEGKYIIPIEIKTGKTPSREPYQSHEMQLMAYCYLVEEIYGIRPPGGYIKYPEKEFKVAYNQEATEGVKELVKEILKKKKSREEIFCKHSEHT